VRATAKAEVDNFMSNLDNVGTTFNKLLTYWKRVTIDGVEYELVLNTASNTIGFNYIVSGEQKTFSTLYYVDGTKIVLVTPFVNGQSKVTALDNLTFSGGAVSASVNGKAVQVVESAVPMKLDANAPMRWYNQMAANFNNCWVSDLAFHANGVDDYCGFKAVPSYQTLWYAGPAVFGGTSEGLITFTTGLVTPYALSKLPFTVTNGKGRFTLNTSTTGFVTTTPLGKAMTEARALMYGGATANSFQDWYFVQTSSDGLRYDMVRASDAKAWISWRPR
jgi:hypothetical protein